MKIQMTLAMGLVALGMQCAQAAQVEELFDGCRVKQERIPFSSVTGDKNLREADLGDGLKARASSRAVGNKTVHELRITRDQQLIATSEANIVNGMPNENGSNMLYLNANIRGHLIICNLKLNPVLPESGAR